MKQHTPGPWRTVVASAHEFNPNTRRRDIIGRCEFGDAYVAGDISQEDARLIAAAPDLLSALNLLLDKLHAHAPGLIDCEYTEGAIVKAEMAIAKAKGEA